MANEIASDDGRYGCCLGLDVYPAVNRGVRRVAGEGQATETYYVVGLRVFCLDPLASTDYCVGGESMVDVMRMRIVVNHANLAVPPYPVC